MCNTQQHLQGQAGNQCTASCAFLNLSAATPGSCSCTKLSLLSIFRLSQRWREQPTLQCNPSPAPHAHQGHLFPAGEPCHAEEHSGDGHKRLEGSDPHGCRWEKCSPQLSWPVPRRCPPQHRHNEGHKPLPSTRDLGAEDEVPVAGPSGKRCWLSLSAWRFA